jgi:hypothetical protein
MRENRPYGSEGGESGSTGLPYPYRATGWLQATGGYGLATGGYGLANYGNLWPILSRLVAKY